MTEPAELLIVGKVGTAFGVKGWVKVHSFTDHAESIFDYQPWLLGKDTEFAVCNWRHHAGNLVVQLEGCSTRDQAEQLTNLDISVSAGQLPALDDAYYWRDLIGCRVVTESNYDLGTVSSLLETGSNDVLVVKPNSRDAFGKTERMVPFLQTDVVKSVIIADKTIIVDWDPGF